MTKRSPKSSGVYDADAPQPVRSKNRNDSRKRGLSRSWSGLAGCPPLRLRRSGSCSLRRGEGGFMEWTRILAYITGSVDQELLLRNEYLAAENRILRAKLNRRLRFSDAERATLGEIGFRLGRRALSEVATAAQPDTILAWYRRLVARKFDGSQAWRSPGRPRIDQEVEGLIIRMARENCSWGYDRIVGALANLGYHVSDQTIGNVLRRTVYRPHPSADVRLPGQNSFGPTSPSSRQPTSSRSR